MWESKKTWSKTLASGWYIFQVFESHTKPKNTQSSNALRDTETEQDTERHTLHTIFYLHFDCNIARCRCSEKNIFAQVKTFLTGLKSKNLTGKFSFFGSPEGSRSAGDTPHIKEIDFRASFFEQAWRVDGCLYNLFLFSQFRCDHVRSYHRSRSCTLLFLPSHHTCRLA